MIKDRDTTIGYHCPFCGMSILNSINIFSMTGNLIKLKCVCGGSELIVQILKDNKYRITVPCILCPNSHSFTLSSSVFFKKDLFSFSCKFTAVDICFIGRSNKVYEALKKNEQELMEAFAAYEEEYGADSDGSEPHDDLFLDGGGFFEEGGYFDDSDDDEDDDWYEYDDDENEEFDDYGGDFLLSGEPDESGFILHKRNNHSSYLSDKPKNSEYLNEAYDDDSLDNLKVRSYQIVTHILDRISKLYAEKKIVCECGDLDGKIVVLGNSVHIECKNCGSYRNIKSYDASDAEYLDNIDELYLDFDD